MDFFSKCKFPADLVTFTEEILMENFIFCAVSTVVSPCEKTVIS